MKLYSIDAGRFKLDGGAMFGVVPKSIWQRTNPADERNLCTWALRLLLIEDEDRLILVDTGMGNKQSDKFFSYYEPVGTDVVHALKKQGFHPDEITDVFLTHLHFDHVGGAIRQVDEQLLPTFKNARYWSNEQHWNWAIHPNAREKASFLKENLLPIEASGQLHFITHNNARDFHPDIRIRYAFGHTDAMMMPQINYKGKTILYMADLLPSVGHIPLPYVMGYDMFPMKTLEERQSYWKEIVENDYILFLEHDPQHSCCTLQQTEKGIRLKDTFSLEDL